MGKTQEQHNVSPWAFGLGDRLEKALRVARVSNSEMADALGVSANTIGNYTSGRTTPSKLQVKEWAMRTGAPLPWLQDGIEEDSDPEDTSFNDLKQTGLNAITNLADYRAERGALTASENLG